MLNLRNLTLYPSVAARRQRVAAAAGDPAACGRPDRDAALLHGAGRRGAGGARAAASVSTRDFFNVSGLATPDDTTIYEDCQHGFGAMAIDYHQGYAPR
ncbi:MAG: hypothetical protein WDO24_13930, partial [Pseudomonadota bacterium]